MSGITRGYRRLLAVGWTAVMLLSGCVALSEPRAALTPEGYAFHKEETDVAVHWNLTREAGQVTARGYVQSVTPPTILLRSVHVTLVGYDEQGRAVVRSRPVFTNPSELNVEEPPLDKGSFEVSLAVGELPVRRFDVETFYLWRQFPEEKRRRKW